MSTLTDQDAAIAARCAELGLSRPEAQALADAGPFPSTVEQVLGFDNKPGKRWLWMAAQTSSVGYQGTLTPEVLLGVLVIGNVPAEFGASSTWWKRPPYRWWFRPLRKHPSRAACLSPRSGRTCAGSVASGSFRRFPPPIAPERRHLTQGSLAAGAGGRISQIG